jgi:hypothetical protein
MGQWLVAKVGSEHLQYCERGVVNGSISEGYHDEVVRRLNQLCDYCGALPVDQLRKGLKKPPSRPRLHSLSDEEEAAVYKATDEPFGDFLFAAIHTGLRPFCELARVTADDVIETNRGMMWRVYSSKTRKTRKIPVR